MPRESTRLSGTSYAVLGLIAAWGPCTPYDLKQAIEATVENFWPVPHTTFYVEPARLEKAGLLSVDQEEHGRRRKLYAITDDGRAALDAWVAEPKAAAPQLRDELMLKIFLGADPQPLVGERLAWYRDKLEELEGYLSAVRSGEGTAGMERSLIAGTAYARAMIAMMEDLGATG
jgi:PadR family transcriptional regulator, regulatory protein AphA